MLLGAPHAASAALIAAMPRQWSVLQAAVIAEPPYMRHLHRRLSSAAARHERAASGHERARSGGSAPPTAAEGGSAAAAAPIVPRATLRGLSWPFTEGHQVVENRTWLKPYWSAAAYAVSPRGAAALLERYWLTSSAASIRRGGLAGEPRKAAWSRARAKGGAALLSHLVDTRSQLWPAADQLLFNVSGTYLTPPWLTQPVTGAHAEHMQVCLAPRSSMRCGTCVTPP
jgi:hypothetical protein